MALVGVLVQLALMNLMQLAILIIIYLSGSNDVIVQESTSSEQNI